ncbi:MAG: DHCW motif cupin fold protein [Gloeobacteraceae cyanobacterium ES-bin-316]|nr:DHCW motif cupin fold protein [Ferruginibacter sp.]
MSNIMFQTIDWKNIEKIMYIGNTGNASWQTLQFEGLRLRLVEYSANYAANHWCEKGHIVHCLEGEFETELESGEKSILSGGMSYIVSDYMSSHRSVCKTGAKLLIIDGDFLTKKYDNNLFIS